MTTISNQSNTTSRHSNTPAERAGEPAAKRERIVRRVARELRDGYYVNLGIGLPITCRRESKSFCSLKMGCWAWALIRSRAMRIRT